jgi:4-alpha-glucanotransferase
MRVCGIDLKANNAIFSVIETNDEDDIAVYIDMQIKKLSLGEDEKQEDIRNFCNELLHFLMKNDINKVKIKKRAKKGNFAGGAITFKMEALIQLNPHCEVELVTSQSISKYQKKNEINFPSDLNKYQEQAYLSALVSI